MMMSTTTTMMMMITTKISKQSREDNDDENKEVMMVAVGKCVVNDINDDKEDVVGVGVGVWVEWSGVRWSQML